MLAEREKLHRKTCYRKKTARAAATTMAMGAAVAMEAALSSGAFSLPSLLPPVAVGSGPPEVGSGPPEVASGPPEVVVTVVSKEVPVPVLEASEMLAKLE